MNFFRDDVPKASQRRERWTEVEEPGPQAVWKALALEGLSNLEFLLVGLQVELSYIFP